MCCATFCPGKSVYGRSSLIFEDLKQTGFTVGHVTDVKDLAHETSLSAIRVMARIHAWGWGKPATDDSYEESVWVSMCSGHLKLGFKLFDYQKAVDNYLTMWTPREHAADLRDSLVQEVMYDVKANQANWFERGKALPRNQTIMHGDFHKGNLFFRDVAEGPTDPSEVIVLDWAFFGHGHCSWEINYLFLLSADKSCTLEQEFEICKAYHEELLKCNPDVGYSLEELLADVKLTAFMQYVFLICNQAQAAKAGEYDEQVALGGSDRDIVINDDRIRKLLLKRIMNYRAQPKECWGDFFSGVGAEEARAAAALRAPLPAAPAEAGSVEEGVPLVAP